MPAMMVRQLNNCCLNVVVFLGHGPLLQLYLKWEAIQFVATIKPKLHPKMGSLLFVGPIPPVKD